MEGKNEQDSREIPDQEQEFGADDTVYRGMPSSVSGTADEETFTLNELEGDMDRGMSSSNYEPRSVAVASRYDQEDGLSFLDYAAPSSHREEYVSKGVASFSKASMEFIVPEPPSVPPSPFHLDLNTHVVSKSAASAAQIHSMLRETFESHHVDTKFMPCWLFVAKAYPDNEMVDFRVRLYDTTRDSYKLEFQLRDGNRLAYHQLMSAIKLDLNLPSSHVKIGTSSNFSSSSAATFGTTSTEEGGKNDVSNDEETVKQVIKMVDSKYIDVKLDGLKQARKFCANQSILPTFVRHQGIASILTAIKTEARIMEVQRCGAAALFTYCMTDKDGRCDALIKAPEGLKQLRRLARLGPADAGSDSKSSGGFSFFEEEEEEGDDITHLEVQRQAASALMWLAKRAGTNTYVEDVGGASLFEELKKSGDPRLEFIAAKGLEHMQSTRTHC